MHTILLSYEKGREEEIKLPGSDLRPKILFHFISFYTFFLAFFHLSFFFLFWHIFLNYLFLLFSSSSFLISYSSRPCRPFFSSLTFLSGSLSSLLCLSFWLLYAFRPTFFPSLDLFFCQHFLISGFLLFLLKAILSGLHLPFAVTVISSSSSDF